MMNEQEILSKIAFIQLMQKNYKGDGLDLSKGGIALVSNEKYYNLMHKFPNKFDKIDFKDIPTETLKHIYNHRNRLVEKDNGRLIYEAELFDFLVDNPPIPKEGSGLAITKKEKIPDSTVSIKNQSDKARNVFVIHGRNEKARKALFQFLRAIDLEPLEWRKLIGETEKGSPYIGEILDKAFEIAQAVIVLMTGDDIAYIRNIYLDKDEEAEIPTPQARPNVLFEAGMAFGNNPDKTIIVELGKTRKYSDVEGRHVIKMDNSPSKRSELAERLKKAGCSVKTEGKEDWFKEGDFEAALPPDYLPDEGKPDKSSDKKDEAEAGASIISEVEPLVHGQALSEDQEKILKFLNENDGKKLTANIGVNP